MATNETSTGSTPDDEYAPRREEFADFALVLKNGQEVKCHKVILARVSPFFCTMLRQDCVETKSSKMKVTDFEPETVQSFLDYIYADLERLSVMGGEEYTDIYQRKFEMKRLTPELLRMAHMYQEKNLQDMCIEHFKDNIENANAVAIWTVAETIGNDELKKVALDHLGKEPSKLLQVPGLKTSFHSPQLVESLVAHMAQSLVRDEVITVNVQCLGTTGAWLGVQLRTIAFQLKLSRTVMVLRQLITDWHLDTYQSRAKCRRGSLKEVGSNTPFEEDRTLDSYNLRDGVNLVCDLEQI